MPTRKNSHHSNKKESTLKHRKNTLETGEILFLSWNERQARATVIQQLEFK